MFAAFHIADLPVVAALWDQPAWRGRPCGILREATDRADGKIPLLALNAVARDTGISAGWPLARALVRCPDLKLLSRHLETEAMLFKKLIELAESFTPDVEITSSDTVLLDLAGTKRVDFDGLETLPDCEVEVCHALAETPDLAHFAVLEPQSCGRFISTREIGSLPLSLISRLEGGEKFPPLLDLLGLRTLADYCRLPRQDLIARFGPVAGHWHDLISGKARRLLKLHRPPESLRQSIDFDDAIDSSEALVFILNRLLHVLGSRLAARHLAASVLEIRLRLEHGEMRREIRLPEPLSDPAALLKPIQTMAESLVLSSPVVGLELDATAAIPLARQNDWTRRQLPNPGRWADTLARLEALVGGGLVGIPVPLAVHRPDAFRMRDAGGGDSASPPAGGLPPCSIPLRRFRPPLEISVASESRSNGNLRPLALLTGPYRGEVLEQCGPFITSGDLWNPDLEWGRLEWDIRVDHFPLLRLVYQKSGRWQLDGIYF